MPVIAESPRATSPDAVPPAHDIRQHRVDPPHPEAVGFAPNFVAYEHGLRLQAEAAERLDARVDHGTLLLLEHDPVYTAGRRSSPDEYPTDGTPVVPVDRGGRVTWHGPGQLVVYPIVRLAPRVGVVDVVRALESAIISALNEVGVQGHRVTGRSGVWAETGGPASPPHPTTPPEPASPSLAKVAQIGLHVRAGIVTHGLAINCSNDLEPFTRFVPCGIRDAGVTTVSALAGHQISPKDLAPILQPHLLDALAELVA